MGKDFSRLHWTSWVELEEYLAPTSLAEALEMLNRFGGQARVIAGGTDVIPQLRKKDLVLKALVDVTGLPGMKAIAAEGDRIVLGGLVTHAQAAGSPLVREKAGLLAEGCSQVGSPQIRNVATLAGNLISGQPAADASIPLLALDASVTIASLQGERVVPLSEFFLGVGKTALDPAREILTRIEFPAMGANHGGCYQRLAKRKALTLPMLVCAVKVEVDPARKTFADVAVALGPVAPTPLRARPTEDFLRGKSIDRRTVEQAASDAVAYCTPRDSLLRGSCDYRQEMVKVMVRRGLERSLAQAGYPLI
ncbi:MAG: xanthine dehydrogenase family protein subunit M [Pseudomonadota bacterium]